MAPDRSTGAKMASKRRSPSMRRPSPSRARPADRLEEIRASLTAGWTAPVARLVGFHLTRIERGRCVVEMDADDRHANPMGTLHGGVMCDIADAAMGTAYASSLTTGESFTTIELKINFLRPFWSGRLVADGSILRKGRAFGLLQCRVSDGSGRLVAFATATCMTLPAGPDGSLGRAPNTRSVPAPVRRDHRPAAK